jgi:RNA polymerase sigma-70 factor (ECF subfamily)
MSDSLCGAARRPDPLNVALVRQLFLLHESALRGYLYRRVRSGTDAQELAQEVYLRLLQVPDVRAVRNPQAYLYTIAANLLKEHRRKQLRRGFAVAPDDPAVEEQLSETRCAAEELDRQRRLQRLGEVIGQLSPKCQAVVALHFWQGLSYDEVAARIGISPHMVKKYVSQALAHCRRRMSALR